MKVVETSPRAPPPPDLTVNEDDLEMTFDTGTFSTGTLITDSAAESYDLTRYLEQWAEGDKAAADQVLAFLYRELRHRAASDFRRERADHTLQATAVVHELYLALVEQTGLRFENREHFLALASHMMRRILVDHARRRARVKRGGRMEKVVLEDATALVVERPDDLVALDGALQDLARMDPRKADLVELRFFGGLSLPEAAQVLGISRATAVREWRRARAWLYIELGNADEERP